MRSTAKTAMIAALSVSLVANAVLISMYLAAQAAASPGWAAYDTHADIYNAATAVQAYRTTHRPRALDRAALWIELAAGTVMGSHAFGNFADMCDNLAGDLAYGKDVAEASNVVLRMSKDWPNGPSALARDESSVAAFNQQLEAVMAKLPEPGATPLY